MKRSRIQSLIPALLNSLESDCTRRAYASQLSQFCVWWDAQEEGPLDRQVLAAYSSHLRVARKSAATRRQAIACIRRLAEEAGSPIAGKVRTPKTRGNRTGQWLTRDQARTLIQAPNLGTLAGKRDRVMLGLLCECGLRREEAAALDVSQIQERDGRTVIADLKGKGGRVRTVPVHWRTAAVIHDWIRAAGIDSGPLLVMVNKADRIEHGGERISTTAIYKRVRKYAEEIGVEIRPHDLRRTFGKLARQRGADLDQIQASLGHASVKTTEVYLGDTQTLAEGATPSDMLDLEGDGE